MCVVLVRVVNWAGTGVTWENSIKQLPPSDWPVGISVEPCPPLPSYSSFLPFYLSYISILLPLLFETVSPKKPRLAWNSLFRLGGPQTHRVLPASACQVLESKVFASAPNCFLD